MNNEQNVKLNTYKDFYNKGIWDKKIVDFLRLKGHIDSEEYNFITEQSRKSKDSRISNEEFTYEIWDMNTPINGVPAEVILRDGSLKNASAIFLIKSPSTGRVVRIESKDIIMDNNRLRSSLSTEDVAQFYLDQMKQMDNLEEVDYEEVKVGTQIYTKIIEIDQFEEMKNLLIKNNELLENIKKLLERDVI